MGPNFTVRVSPASVHVGDVGTIYTGRLTSLDPPFDPVAADVTQLLFYFIDGSVLAKDAELIPDPDAGSPVDAWLLTYRVHGDDGVGSPAGIFHKTEGPLRIQAFLEWTSVGSPSAEHLQLHSDIATVDTEGQELRIFPNVD